MKLQGFLKGSGKIGSIVTSQVGGQTIAREYQPNVSNPATMAQTDQRAKLKLMSQLAAALSPVIIIPKDGLKSSRNLFIKKNYGLAVATDGVAQVTYENLQLTSGNAALPGIHVTRGDGNAISVALTSAASTDISRVIYIGYKKNSESLLEYVTSVQGVRGDDNMFAASLGTISGDVVVFAYGMRDADAKATARFNNYHVTNGEDVAKLIASRSLASSGYSFTQTRGTTLYRGENESESVGEQQARVYVTAGEGGTVSGGGVYDLGTVVTVTATPNNGYGFRGWYTNDEAQRDLTDANIYSFTLTGQADLIALFYEEEDPDRP